ncbi:DUF6000 family protein [Pasteurella skyensis]|uniref:DUF6000 family protein n=1 Tax=Phocoenobacter skyensis TaxID=97481 RepID=A0AAJ6P2H2_9PAST|nr:DUF6000 family protein [Pasteurella skyensis]MDP8171245.1 DUF6000 family protein [Pasteurella skyensis]MDP8174693.1 DUF6000 family protein [Pasteurella skyensis]
MKEESTNPFSKLNSFHTENEYDEDFYDKFVMPFYCVTISKMPTFKEDYLKIKKEVNSEIVKKIIGEYGWRDRIVGAYFCAIENLIEFEDIIGLHLLKSEFVYSGRGYALALANFGTKKSISYLKKYLDYYLTRKDLFYDQHYVICALKWIDNKTNSSHSKEFMERYQEWGQNSIRDLEDYYKEFKKQMIIIEELSK